MTNQYKSTKDHIPSIKLRGYERVGYPAPELFGVRLPVNLLTFNLCKTQRDVFLHVTGHSMPETWERYYGRVIHTLYQEILSNILKIVGANSIGSLDLGSSLTNLRNTILASSLRKHRDVLKKVKALFESSELETLQAKLKSDMEKIFCYEKGLSSALVNFELSSLYNQSSGNPLFQKTFALSAGESYNAHVLGFTNPVTPDFRYKNDVVGDIKTGPWRDYYYHTLTAYALSIEAHTRSPVDCGIILHVQILDRTVPIHELARFEVIDDFKRKRFLMIRDEKLRVAKEKVDPGRPVSSKECEGCGFYNHCWEDQM